MYSKYINRSTYQYLCLLLLFVYACKKDDVLNEARLFRPVAKGGLQADGNWIGASWQSIKGAVAYEAQVSRDTFRTVEVAMQVDKNTIRIENLRWNQLYQVRVRALAEDTALNSKMSDLGAIKTAKFPTILVSPTISDVTDEAIKVRWTNSGATVTSIKVLKASDSSLVKEVPLTATDVTSQYKIISGLAGASTYIIYLYSGTSVRGWDNYSTKSALAGNLIDLRGITGRPGVLADTLPLVPSGSTIILKRGETYTITTAISLNKSVTITSGADLAIPDQPLISITAGNAFNFTAGSVIDYIDFKDVKLVTDSYAGKYVFNTTNSATVGRISFESCRAEIMRGLVRLQSGTTTLSNFMVNNCILDSIAGYGVITIGSLTSTTCKAENISIKNSTIYKAEVVVAAFQNSTSVTIESCTVNEAPKSGGFLVDYSTTYNVTNGITVTKCLFGIGKAGASVKGVRAGTSTTITGGGNYSTADYTVTGNAIPGVTKYTKNYTELFG